MKPDGIWGGGASYPGKPSCPVVEVARDDRKPTRRGDPEARRDRAWQIYGEYRRGRADEGLVTAWREDPEDQAEGEKHAGETSEYAAVWRSWRCHPDRGNREREVVVIASRSRNRAVTDKDQKTSCDKRIAKRYLGANALGSSSMSGPDRAASASPVTLGGYRRDRSST
jgi:hypothetical protein